MNKYSEPNITIIFLLISSNLSYGCIGSNLDVKMFVNSILIVKQEIGYRGFIIKELVLKGC